MPMGHTDPSVLSSGQHTMSRSPYLPTLAPPLWRVAIIVGLLSVPACARPRGAPSLDPSRNVPRVAAPRQPSTAEGSTTAVSTPVPTATVGPAAAPVPGPLPLTPGSPLPAPHVQWIDRTLRSLTLRQRVAQMMMVWVLGDYTNARDPGFVRLVGHVERDGIGGVVMSLGSPIEVAEKLNALQRRATVPLLVASDVEPGLGRMEGGVFVTASYSAGSATVLPSNMAIGAADDDSVAEAMGRITGLESRAVGIHMAFAPVVDVNNNPANPVINTRSFGEDPQRVAALAAAFVRGVQSAGVAATAKHFPGHGDTDTDSHLGLPVITVPRERLDAVELVPFASAIGAGAAGMMTAHIALPVAYGDSTPATLSSRVMRGLLRDTLGFSGVTVTDAMTMEGIAKGFGTEESSIRAVEAGDDIILMPSDVGTAIDAIVRAVESGRLSATRIDESVRRILALKLRTGAASTPQVSLDSLRGIVADPAHRALAQRAAERAITLLRDSATLVPVRRTGIVHVITVVPDNDPQAGTWFAAEMRTGDARVRTTRLSPRAQRRELDSLARVVRKADRVVVYSYTRTLEGEGRLAIPSPIAGFVSRLAPSKKLIVVAGGNPYQIRQMSKIPTYLVTYGRGEALERAAARAILGTTPITGRTPVSLPGHFARGEGLTRVGNAGGTR
jgi:beta-N-acetylhexosaminidase